MWIYISLLRIIFNCRIYWKSFRIQIGLNRSKMIIFPLILRCRKLLGQLLNSWIRRILCMLWLGRMEKVRFRIPNFIILIIRRIWRLLDSCKEDIHLKNKLRIRKIWILEIHFKLRHNRKKLIFNREWGQKLKTRKRTSYKIKSLLI